MMQVAAVSAAALAQGAPAPAARLEPGTLATERFKALMSAPPQAPQTPPVLAGAPGVTPAAAGAQPATMGGQILSGLRAAGADFSQKWQGIAQSLDQMGNRKASVGDMLRLQGQVLQMTVEYQLVGKAVSSTVNSINTLTRMS